MGVPPITRGLARRLDNSSPATPDRAAGNTPSNGEATGPARPWAPGGKLGSSGLQPVAPAEPAPPGLALAAPGLYLSASGHIVTRQWQAESATARELGATLTQAAEAMGRGLFPFAVKGIPFEQKAAAFTNLSEAIDLGLDPAHFDGNADQALQTRAAAAPLLLDLAESLDVTQPEQKALFAQLFARYEQATKSEPHPDLRAFMSADLARIKNYLPSEAGPAIDRLASEVAPASPIDDRDGDGVLDNWDHLFTVNAF